MKIIVTICRWLVGLLFIFSGLIKANDPHGLSYKMREFFEAWHTEFLNSLSLISSIAMNIVEVVAGIAILIGWRSKFFSWLLLLLITFFTFLTSYVLFSGKIAACGCFGDCVPLTPQQTFTKDVVLLILILIIFFSYKKIQPILSSKISIAILTISFLLVGGMQWYALNHLPFKDCLPFKKGNNIVEQMKPPVGAVSDSFAIFYTYKKNGQIIKINAEKFPDDFDSTYIQVGEEEKTLIRKGNSTPKISDFTLKTLDSSINITDQVLNQSGKYVMIFVKEFPSNSTQLSSFINLDIIKKYQAQNLPVYIVTSDVEAAVNVVIKGVTFLKLDGTVLKTAARANPTYFLMQGATILNKVAAVDAGNLGN
jgi:uncharacterized membrane protein YphA (DoxX/SURF4 family)